MTKLVLIILACVGQVDSDHCAPIPVTPPTVVTAKACERAAREAVKKLGVKSDVILGGFHCGFIQEVDDDPRS